jgi:hypothetical protein
MVGTVSRVLCEKSGDKRLKFATRLIPERACGGCTVCCVSLTIDRPEIQKLSGVRCHHSMGGDCSIYEGRPPVCRSFYCAWRTVDIFSADWRPDKSGVLALVETEGIPEDFELSTGIKHMLVGDGGDIIRQAWFRDFVVTGVMSSVPLFLGVPGPRGHQAASVFLNTQHMLDAIRHGTVKEALEAALKILKAWNFCPAPITHSGNDVSLPE